MLCQQVDSANDLVLVDAVLAYVCYASKDSTAFKVAVDAANVFSAEEITASKKALYDTIAAQFKDSHTTVGRSASEANIIDIYGKLAKINSGTLKIKDDKNLHFACPAKLIPKMPKSKDEASTMDAMADKISKIEDTIKTLSDKVDKFVDKPSATFADTAAEPNGAARRDGIQPNYSSSNQASAKRPSTGEQPGPARKLSTSVMNLAEKHPFADSDDEDLNNIYNDCVTDKRKNGESSSSQDTFPDDVPGMFEDHCGNCLGSQFTEKDLRCNCGFLVHKDCIKETVPISQVFKCNFCFKNEVQEVITCEDNSQRQPPLQKIRGFNLYYAENNTCDREEAYKIYSSFGAAIKEKYKIPRIPGEKEEIVDFAAKVKISTHKPLSCFEYVKVMTS